MSRSIHFISSSIPGSGPPDARCLPCSGISSGAFSISLNSSRGDYKLFYNPIYLSLKCSSRVIACNATSYRRNPDSSVPNRRRFSRNRNNNSQNEEREGGSDDLEGSETLSSRNGPFYPDPKFQATATPGPREKEIVELFKKVQVQLRERASSKEEGKKIEQSKGKSKESETVDSLLELLRKHSVQKVEKKIVTSTEAKSTTDPTNHVKREVQESPGKNLSRPKSIFRKKSPVPEIKFQPIYPEDDFDSISLENLDMGKNTTSLEPEEVVDPFSDGNESDEISEDELYENGPDELEQERKKVQSSDVRGMKLPELRELAKSQGLKGYSKLKKSELIELLSE